jgi:hypothetical protein
MSRNQKIIIGALSILVVCIFLCLGVALLARTAPRANNVQAPTAVSQSQSHTATSIPIVSPSPTALNEPSPTTLPTISPTPSDPLRQIAESGFGAKLLEAKLETRNGSNLAKVSYDLDDYFDEGSYVYEAQRNLIKFAPQVFRMPAVDELELGAFTTFVDTFGNKKHEVAIRFNLKRALAQKINWDGMDSSRLELAFTLEQGGGIYIHPALKSAWAESQK